MLRKSLIIVVIAVLCAVPSFAEDFPVSYDLRALGRVTPARFQNPWGTCWAFGALGAVESNYLTRSQKGELDGRLGNAENLNLSVLHMTWYSKNDPNKTKNYTEYYARELSIASINGGYPSTAIAYMARLDGPVLESSLPYISETVVSRDAGYNINTWYILDGNREYPSYNAFQEMTQTIAGKKYLPELNTLPQKYGVVLRMTDALYGVSAPIVGETERKDFPDDKRVIDIETTKRLIMEHGAVEMGYYSSGNLMKDTSAYYVSGKKSDDSNHAAMLVGWDDNFPRENFASSDMPASNGAWLVKNSWSEDYGDKGFFWISYEQPIGEGIAFIVDDMPSNLRVYDYDPTGWCNIMGNSRTGWAANTFKVKSDGESLESIAFYTTEANASCEWQIFYNLGTNKPMTAPYVAGAVSVSGSKTFPYAGYHTIKLDSPIPLNKGTYFSVVVKFTNPTSPAPVATESKIKGYTDFAVVHDGESWFSDDGAEWIDGTELIGEVNDTEDEVEDTENDRAYHIPQNACIKAFTVDTVNDEDVSVDKISILGINVVDVPNIVNVTGANKGIPDEPLSERLLVLPSRTDVEKYYTSADMEFYLINVTETREYVETYGTEDTRYPKGLLPYKDEAEFVPLYEEGYYPDIFFKDNHGVEYPSYGPFYGTTNDRGEFYLDVNNLVKADRTKGVVSKGYYEFVYHHGTDNFAGVINLRLAATDISSGTSSDMRPSPENEIRGSSSSGCASGVSGMYLALIAGFALMRKRH